MDRVFLVGSEGYIGQRLYTKLTKHYDVGCIDLHAQYPFDLNRPSAFEYNLFDEDTLIITAAISSPDVCEKEYDKAYKINVEGTKHLIQEALDRKCRVLFFSSDAVFGFNNKIVDENTETCGDTAYGRMKKAIEDQFKGNPNFKAIRLSYVFSKYDKYTLYLLNCIEQEKTAEVFHPFYRNAVALEDVLDVVQWIVMNWKEFDSTFLNVCGKELVSRLRIADEVIRCTNRKLNYVIQYPGDEFYKNRPPILEMQSLYLQKILDTQESFSKKVEKQFK